VVQASTLLPAARAARMPGSCRQRSHRGMQSRVHAVLLSTWVHTHVGAAAHSKARTSAESLLCAPMHARAGRDPAKGHAASSQQRGQQHAGRVCGPRPQSRRCRRGGGGGCGRSCCGCRGRSQSQRPRLNAGEHPRRTPFRARA